MYEDKIKSYIAAHEAEMRDALAALVRIPSVEGVPGEGMPFGKDVRAALDKTLGIADALGFETRNLDGYIGFADYGEGEETLGIMMHLDVVPEGSGWKHDPYGAEIVDGRMYGRGTQDDKGPVISALYALAAVKSLGVKLSRKVRLLFGCDEESGWLDIDHYKKLEKLPDMAFSPDAEYPVVNSEKGILHLKLSRPLTRSSLRINAGTMTNVIPGEATASVPFDIASYAGIINDALGGTGCKFVPGEDGRMITIKGLGGHASTPQLGKNALQAMLRALSSLPLDENDSSLILMLSSRFGLDMHGESIGMDISDEQSGRLTLVPATIEWTSSSVSITVDVRYPMSADHKKLTEHFASMFPGFNVTIESYNPPHYVSPDSELVTTLLSVYERCTGLKPHTLAIGGGTYARAIPNAVTFGCQFPDSPSLMHMPDEYIELSELTLNAKLIANAIMALAG